MAVRSIKHTLFPIAGASDRSTAAPRDAGQNYTKTFDDARRAVDVYDRGRSITQFLATGHHVEPVFFWQPVVQGPVEHLADSLIDSPTLNISDTLDDHPEVYIDGGHTNERGAELVAERIWKTIGSKTRHWYRANPRASGGDVRSTSTSTSLVALPSTSASPQAAAADSNQELLDQARLQLDQALGHPCALKEFTPWITLMRASNPSEIAQVGELAQRYFVGLAAAAPSSAAAAAEAVRRAAPSFSSLIASASYDPKQPILPQLAGVVDPVFLRSLQTLIDAQTTTCISTNHTGR